MNEKLYYFVHAYLENNTHKTMVHKPIIVTVENWHGSQAIIRRPNGQLLLVDYYSLWSFGESLTCNDLDREIKRYYGDEAVYL